MGVQDASTCVVEIISNVGHVRSEQEKYFDGE
jgi:hypothetical protein